MASTQADVAVAAIEWWRNKKPLSFTYEAHLDNPTINCSSDTEKALAEAVAEYLDDRDLPNSEKR